MAVTLPKAHVGACDATLRYSVPAGPFTEGKKSTFTLPLVMPAEGKIQSNRLYAAGTPGMTLEASAGTWIPAVEEAQRTGLALAAVDRAESATIGVALRDKNAQPGTLVERLWVQTWLTQSERQDRAVFRFVSDEK
jgi:hypothetical protein